MRTRRTVLAGLAAGLAGCGVFDGPEAVEGEITPPGATTEAWYTHAQPTGNRTLPGDGAIGTTEPIEFSPNGRPQWLVARPTSGGSRWTVATADGSLTDWDVSDGTGTRERAYDSIPAETQPVVRRGPGGVAPLYPPGELSVQASPMIRPVTSDRPSQLLYMAGNGDLVITGSETVRLPVDGLPDGRLAALGDGRYALFGDATDRYNHGALGDSIEGETLYVVDADEGELVAQSTLDPPAVFEGLQPLVADMDDDGRPEIVTTVADSADGARIAVFSPSAQHLATGPIHEPGWRHQLAVAPFGPGGESELAVVRKPHVDRVLEFYRLRDGGLNIVATATGVSSHSYGSRILDGALAGSFTGDGTPELLVPTAPQDELAVIRRGRDGASVASRLSLDGQLTSNITGVTRPDGGVVVGVATATTVRVWQP